MSFPLILLIVAVWFALVCVVLGMLAAASRNDGEFEVVDELHRHDDPSEWAALLSSRELRIARATQRVDEQAAARQLLNEERAAAERNFPAA